MGTEDAGDGRDTLMARMTPEPNSGCWLWLGTLDRYGYGRIRLTDRRRTAHRFAYEMFKGAVPAGLTLDHKCRVRCCVNPEHLEPVINRENVLRGESFMAVRARREFCARGHALTPDNVMVRADGGRRCRKCKSIANREYKERRRAR